MSDSSSNSAKNYIIVTGGAGFIGSHTVVQLFQSGFIPVIIDDFRNSEYFIINRIENILKTKIIVHNCDCSISSNIEAIFQLYKPFGVIHFAANKAVGESVDNPLLYYHNNINSLLVILNACQKYQIKNIVFSSSCTVYGEPENIPVTELSPIKNATSPYGYTKQIGERICQDFSISVPNTKIVLLRYFNPIGAHPSGLIGELPIGLPNNLVPYITQTAIGKRKQLTVFGNGYSTPDGTCIRDYIHIVDLANAHVLALQKMNQFENAVEIFNVGTGVGKTVLEVIQAFESINNITLNYTIGPKRSGDAEKIYADNSKIVSLLHWTPKFFLQDAMLHAWNWEKNLKSVAHEYNT